MSLEQAIEANTAALLKLAAAMSSAGVATTPTTVPATTGKDSTKDAKAEANAAEKKAAAAAKAKADKAAADAAAAAAKTPVSEYEREGMVALLAEIKEKTGSVDAARAIIKEVGGVAKMADIPEDKVDAVYLAAKAKIEEVDGGASAEDDGM